MDILKKTAYLTIMLENRLKGRIVDKVGENIGNIDGKRRGEKGKEDYISTMD